MDCRTFNQGELFEKLNDLRGNAEKMIIFTLISHPDFFFHYYILLFIYHYHYYNILNQFIKKHNNKTIKNLYIAYLKLL